MKINRKWCFFLAIIFMISACAKPEDTVDIQNRVVFGFAQLGDESEWRASYSKDINRGE